MTHETQDSGAGIGDSFGIGRSAGEEKAMSEEQRIDREIDGDAVPSGDEAPPAAEPAQRALVSVSAPTNLFCRLGFHRARPSNLWNDGHYFSSCQRCGTMLIRKPESSWKPIPPTMRVVWRRRTDDDIVWPTHIL